MSVARVGSLCDGATLLCSCLALNLVEPGGFSANLILISDAAPDKTETPILQEIRVERLILRLILILIFFFNSVRRGRSRGLCHPKIQRLQGSTEKAKK